MANATSLDERLSACGLLIRVVTLLAMVISRPSSTHATPRATTSIVWKRDQPSRSSRAGMRLRIGAPYRRARIVLSMSCWPFQPPFFTLSLGYSHGRSAPNHRNQMTDSPVPSRSTRSSASRPRRRLSGTLSCGPGSRQGMDVRRLRPRDARPGRMSGREGLSRG